MRQRNLQKWMWIGLLSLYALFCMLMLQITLQYIPIQPDVAFLRIKQDYIGLMHYKWAFFVHVFSAIFVLGAGFTQFSPTLRIRFPQIHRWSGWLYVGITLLFAAPSGFVIGLYANGGFPSQLAFCLLAILWFAFTWMALKRAMGQDFSAHRRWMIRSFALALSAITLRAWKYVLVALFHPRPMDVYMLVAWLGWVLNLLIAEYIIYKSFKK